MFNLTEKGKSVNNITTVGIDLAKNVFSLHGVDDRGREVLRRTIRRAQLLSVVAQLPACLIGLEACSGAHEWARQFSALGHTVRLMAPKFVAPYRRGGKNDGNDAEAIYEAVSRPSMRFVRPYWPGSRAALNCRRWRRAPSVTCKPTYGFSTSALLSTNGSWLVSPAAMSVLSRCRHCAGLDH